MFVYISITLYSVTFTRFQLKQISIAFDDYEFGPVHVGTPEGKQYLKLLQKISNRFGGFFRFLIIFREKYLMSYFFFF